MGFGRVVAIAVGGVGLALCGSVLLRGGGVPVRAEGKAVTWRGEVAPVVFRSCTGCHHAGGSGPFDLTTYASTRRWGPQMAEVVASRYMPPWLPEEGTGPRAVHFEGDRRLKASEVELLTEWVKAGMPEGVGPAPVAPKYNVGWQMGPPDLVLEMPEAVTEPASGSDLFVNFILPAGLTDTRWVKAMEIQPGAGQLVHHANVIVDRRASLRASHAEDWRRGVPGMDLQIDGGDAFDPDSHFLFWKPDSTALVEPAQMPWRLDPGNDLILNMHLKPTGKPETVRARIGLYFTTEPARARPMLIQLEHDAALDIPAGDAHFVVTDELKLPVAVDVLGVYPHAHYLGKEMEGWAVLPDGVRQPIVTIRSWDIDRQSVYSLDKPLALPAGTVLHMRYTYDNSAGNVHNPSSPPVRVRAGNRAADEMSHLWLQVLPHGDGKVDPRFAVERAWMEDTLRKSPGDPLALYNLGALDQMEGQPLRAAEYFQRVLRERPRDARTLTALGSALEASGDQTGAVSRYKEALTVEPGHADAAFDLAAVELKTGQSGNAERLFRGVLAQQPEDRAASEGLAQALMDEGRAGEAEPVLVGVVGRKADDVEARRLLALVYSAEGRAEPAEEQLRAWAKLTPGQPEPHRALAQVLSASGKDAEAVAEQQTVVGLDPENGGDWNDLGVLEARAGKKAEARSAFDRALRIHPGDRAAEANRSRLGGP